MKKQSKNSIAPANKPKAVAKKKITQSKKSVAAIASKKDAKKTGGKELDHASIVRNMTDEELTAFTFKEFKDKKTISLDELLSGKHKK